MTAKEQTMEEKRNEELAKLCGKIDCVVVKHTPDHVLVRRENLERAIFILRFCDENGQYKEALEILESALKEKS